MKDPTISVGESLTWEYDAIWAKDARPPEPQPPLPLPFVSVDAYLQRVLQDDHPKQSALCLSGGGVRSAAFCLGVIQAFATQKLLSRFHYLSTVSGGGYIGCWLQAWLLAAARQQRGAGARITDADIAAVQTALTGPVRPRDPVDALRDYTQYLTPQPGLASPDTWAGIVLWVRNVAVNWAVFGPALFALALLPIGYSDLVPEIPGHAAWVFLLFALAALVWATFGAASSLPSHASPPGGEPEYAQRISIWYWIVLPSLLWAFLLPLAVAPVLPLCHGASRGALAMGHLLVPLGPAMVVGLGSFLALMVAYLAAWWWASCRDKGGGLFFRNIPAWAMACVVAALILGFGVHLGEVELATIASPPDAQRVAAFGPVCAMLAHLSLSTVFVALRRTRTDARGDLDREWLARLSGVKIVPMLLWGIFAAVCLLLRPLLIPGWFPHVETWVTGAFTTVSGIAAALLGKSSKTPFVLPGGTAVLSLETAAAAATLVFAVGLFVLLAEAGQWAVTTLPVWIPWLQRVSHWGLAFALSAALILFASWLGWQVNVNRFSMHNVYRNRLVRAFLGSGRGPARQESKIGNPPGGYDPFTEFDPVDNVRMVELVPEPGRQRRLFPVVGVSLNLVSGVRRAWAERKAAPFTVTPIACGSESLPAKAGMNGKGGRYVRTELYAGAESETGEPGEQLGMTLGTAMAVSGAAVSPSMGYHSSPATSFLMTLFNVRLGIWLPNPGVAGVRRLKYAQPPNSLLALLHEMIGRVGDSDSSIYLSDGGHFDNLGLYEMVRRGCRMIVVIDAGEDPDLAYADLANAVRKIRIDQQVEITFAGKMPMAKPADWVDGNRPFALGTIRWTKPTETTGRLLYIKPCLFDGVPVDLRAYAAQDTAFPNDSTANQFFTESQFESYRKLGQFIGGKLSEAEYAGVQITDFLEELLGHA